jgi:hypothetical protein
MPTIKVSDKTYNYLESRRRFLLQEQIKSGTKRVEVTFEDVITQNFKDMEELDKEVNGLIKQLHSLGVRPFWTKEEVKTK